MNTGFVHGNLRSYGDSELYLKSNWTGWKKLNKLGMCFGLYF